MHIKEVYIHGFGCFIQRRFRFHPGLNVFYGPNGAGKSTLFAFLQGIWFGFLKTGQRRLRQDPRWKRFTPRMPDSFGGQMTVEMEGGALTLCADLAARLVSVFDEMTGQEITGDFVGEDGYLRLGEQLTQMEQGQFELLCFLGQRDVFEETVLADAFQGLCPMTLMTPVTARLEAAKAWLEREAAACGTTKSPTKPRGKLELERAQLIRDLSQWEKKAAQLETTTGEEASGEARSLGVAGFDGYLPLVGGVLAMVGAVIFRLVDASWGVTVVLGFLGLLLGGWQWRNKAGGIPEKTKEAYRDQGRQQLREEYAQELRGKMDEIQGRLRENLAQTRRMDDSLEGNRKTVDLLAALIDKETAKIKPCWLERMKKIYGVFYRKPVSAIYATEQGFRILFQDGSLRDSGALSQGERKLFSLAYRFALCQALEGDECLPWFLDEPFAHLDDDHTKRLSHYLQEESACRQIVLFSCQQRDLSFFPEHVQMPMIGVKE